MGPHIREVFSTVNTTELHDLWLVEPADVEAQTPGNPGFGGTNCELHVDF